MSGPGGNTTDDSFRQAIETLVNEALPALIEMYLKVLEESDGKALADQLRNYIDNGFTWNEN